MQDQPPVPTGRHALSPSKIDALNCRFRYNALYHKGVVEPPITAFQAGSLVHLVARDYYRGLAQDKIYEGSLSLLETIIEKTWEERDSDIGPDIWSDFNEFALNLQWRLFDPTTIAHTELMLAFDADWQPIKCPEGWMSSDVAYGGIVDLVAVIKENNKPLIWATDWTTGGLGASIEAKKDQQLRFYALLLWKLYGIPNVRITVDSLRTGARKTIDLTERDHQLTQLFAESESRRLIALDPDDPEHWPATPGANCSICQLDCPWYANEAIKLIDKMDAADPEAMFQSGLIVEKTLGMIKKALKGHAQFHAPIKLNGMVAEIRGTKRYEWDYNETRALLTELGYDPDLIGALNVTNLRKHLRNDDHLEAVMNLATESVQERFGFYKQKAGEA